jgi:hypothetical protein
MRLVLDASGNIRRLDDIVNNTENISTILEGQALNELGNSSELQAVFAVYDKYGLDKYQTDTEGYKYWVDELQSGTLSMENLDLAIRTAAEVDYDLTQRSVISLEDIVDLTEQSNTLLQRIARNDSSPVSSRSDLEAILAVYKRYGIHTYERDSDGYDYWLNELSTGSVAMKDLDIAIRTAAGVSESLDKRSVDALETIRNYSYTLKSNSGTIAYYLSNIRLMLQEQNKHWGSSGDGKAELTAFGQGGIVTGPTKALIGEAGYSEAVIPLKDPNDPLNMNAVVKELAIMRKDNEAAKAYMFELVKTSKRQLIIQTDSKNLLEEL